MPKINVLHFADIHIGMENYGHIDSATGINSRIVDFLRRVSEVVDYGLSHDVDLVVFAGDAFKTRDPSPTLQREFARRIKRFADAGVPVVMLVGNHDLPAMEKKASSVDIYRTLGVANVIVGWQEEVHLIQTRKGPVQVATVPYPMRNRLMSMPEYRGKSIDEIDKALQEIVGDNIRALYEQLDPAIPAILTAHLTVSGAVFGSERSVMVGRDVAGSQSTLAAGPVDYIALGHIHKHQDLNPGAYPSIVYSGSLERIDFGEEKDDKGFCWIELERHNTTWQFVPVNARPFTTLDFDVTGEDDPTFYIVSKIERSNVEGAIVRVNIKMSPEQSALVRDADIRLALKDASFVAAISHLADRVSRDRLGAAPESLSPLQMVGRYLFAKGVDERRSAELLEVAASIMGGSE